MTGKMSDSINERQYGQCGHNSSQLLLIVTIYQICNNCCNCNCHNQSQLVKIVTIGQNITIVTILIVITGQNWSELSKLLLIVGENFNIGHNWSLLMQIFVNKAASTQYSLHRCITYKMRQNICSAMCLVLSANSSKSGGIPHSSVEIYSLNYFGRENCLQFTTTNHNRITFYSKKNR